MTRDSLGDRVKAFEEVETSRTCPEEHPYIIARLDGRGFSRFTKGLQKPRDPRFADLMRETMEHLLVAVSGCLVGYVQSDEITLIFKNEGSAKTWFGGRLHKMTSVLAGLASSFFTAGVAKCLPERVHAYPHFDCRVWSVPNEGAAMEAILWRVVDAERNSINSLAEFHFPSKELMGIPEEERYRRLLDVGVNWNTWDTYFKHGRLVRKVVVNQPFTTDELESLPPLHQARKNPNLVVERTLVSSLDGSFRELANRVDWLFGGVEPFWIPK